MFEFFYFNRFDMSRNRQILLLSFAFSFPLDSVPSFFFFVLSPFLLFILRAILQFQHLYQLKKSFWHREQETGTEAQATLQQGQQKVQPEKKTEIKSLK